MAKNILPRSYRLPFRRESIRGSSLDFETGEANRGHTQSLVDSDEKSVWATKMTPNDKLHGFLAFLEITFEEPWKTISNLTSGIRIEQIASRVS